MFSILLITNKPKVNFQSVCRGNQSPSLVEMCVLGGICYITDLPKWQF